MGRIKRTYPACREHGCLLVTIDGRPQCVADYPNHASVNAH